MGEASFAGSHPGLRKELPISVWLICKNSFSKSIHLELVENTKAMEMVRPICPCSLSQSSQGAGAQAFNFN